ncbi:MAG: hypothetical protein VX473_03460 [Candidatus Thermoplasmatota archaeon]|nr:hypothetical protein [Candidatus Thermoplasmatota archaeon]
MSKGIFAPLKRWWEGQRDRHLFILGTLSFIGFSTVMWSIIFFFFLGGAQDPDLEHLRNGTWASLVIGFSILIFAGPEFIHYQNQWSFLMEILRSTSRPELVRQRKEAEEAAKLLGSVWSARLKAHFVEYGLTKGRGKQNQGRERVPEDFLINWWGTDDSRLSRMIGVNTLREPWLNRSIGSIALLISILQLWNMSFGLVRNEALERANTLVIWDWLTGARIDSVEAPYFDDISGWLLLLISTFLLWASFPASGERPEAPQLDEEE